MSRIAGTPKSVTIEGVPYDVLGDANISIMLNQWENESIPTSGLPIQKKSKRIATAESVVIGTSWEEKATLIELADSLDKIKFSIEFAGGDTIKGRGQINLDSDESEEMRTTVKFMPDEGWTIFAE